jgi:disulfide bond formation protein DsbB
LRHNLVMRHKGHSLAQYLRMPQAAAVIAVMAIGSLGFALVMEYGFDLQPCVLCLWQRAPFGFAVMFAFAALMWKPYGFPSRVLLKLCAVAFTVGTGLAVFHTGVERHWWLGTSGCSIQPLMGTSPQSLRSILLAMPVSHCDQIRWTFLGLSMANWNVPFSCALALFSWLAALRVRK